MIFDPETKFINEIMCYCSDRQDSFVNVLWIKFTKLFYIVMFTQEQIMHGIEKLRLSKLKRSSKLLFVVL